MRPFLGWSDMQQDPSTGTESKKMDERRFRGLEEGSLTGKHLISVNQFGIANKESRANINRGKVRTRNLVGMPGRVRGVIHRDSDMYFLKGRIGQKET